VVAVEDLADARLASKCSGNNDCSKCLIRLRSCCYE
jgi:hypothetical protein